MNQRRSIPRNSIATRNNMPPTTPPAMAPTLTDCSFGLLVAPRTAIKNVAYHRTENVVVKVVEDKGQDMRPDRE